MTSTNSVSADSMDSNNASRNDGEIDLSQLYSDVFKTLGSLRKYISNSYFHEEAIPSTDAGTETSTKTSNGIFKKVMGSRDDQASPFSKIFGENTCFKTCGMEDIQFAARVSRVWGENSYVHLNLLEGR